MTIEIAVHGSGIIGEPLHLRGEGPAHCLTCHPTAFPATLDLAVDEAAHQRLNRLSERVAVVEQILSDAIPPQPGEEVLDR